MDYSKVLNTTLASLPPSGIRRFFDIANEVKADDMISLSIGEPDFATPWHIREKGITSLEQGKTWYSANAGLLELREAVLHGTRRWSLTLAVRSWSRWAAVKRWTSVSAPW